MKPEDWYGMDDEDESGLHDEPPMWTNMDDARWEKHIEACARILDWIHQASGAKESSSADTDDHWA